MGTDEQIQFVKRTLHFCSDRILESHLEHIDVPLDPSICHQFLGTIYIYYILYNLYIHINI